MRALGGLCAISTLAVLLLASGCSRDDEAGVEPADDPDYKRDIELLCHAEDRSGAQEVEPGHRPVLIAQWLAENLETDRVSDVLVEFQSGSPEEKRAVLEREAAVVGLADCPLADTWASEAAGEGEATSEDAG